MLSFLFLPGIALAVHSPLPVTAVVQTVPEDGAATAPNPAPNLALTLDEALQRARLDNPQIASAKARIEEREGEILSARSQALPKIDFLNNFNRTRDVSILASSMGDLLAKMKLNKEDLVHPISTYSSQLSLQQTLYNFGKVGAVIDIAKLGREEALMASRTVEREILHLVSMLYLNALATQADLEVSQARVRVAEKLVENIQTRLELKDARKLDLQRARTELLLAKTERIQAESAHQKAMEMLNGQIGIKADTILQLSPLPETPASATGEVRRTELEQLQIQKDVLIQNRKVIRSGMLPSLDLSAGYGFLAGDASDLYHKPYDTWRVGIAFKIPLFDGFNTAGKQAQNNARIEQIQQAKIELERKVDVEVASAKREMEKSFAFKSAAEEGHQASLEALRTSQEAFELGVISSLDLLQATREERQAEAMRKKAGIGVWQAVFGLQRAMGKQPSLN